MGFGKYQLTEEKGSGVEIRRGGQIIYRGPWYRTLDAFLERMKELATSDQEYQLELAFDLPMR